MQIESETGAAPPVPPPPEEIRQSLVRILGSKQFSNAPKKQKFLQLICEAYLDGRAGELNEYLIGYEVFGRTKTYNPALDPIVRVGAHELRKKLERYYRSEGKNDEILLEVPIGSYIPIFTRRPPPPPPPPPPEAGASTPVEPVGPAGTAPAPAVPRSSIRIGVTGMILIGLAFVFLIMSVVMTGVSNRQLRRQLRQGAPPQEIAGAYRLVWGPFLKDADPTLLVLSNPTVYRFWNPADPESLSGRSIDLTAAETAALEKTLGRDQFVLKQNRPPRLLLSRDEYTGLGEAVGLHLLTGLFKGIGKNIAVKQSRTVSAEDLKNQNVILLGSVWVNEWSGKDLIKEDFTSGTNAAIINHNPLPGESREYKAGFDRETGRLIEDYSLITVKPNISEKNVVMVLAGTHSQGTEAAAEYLTGEDRLANLNHRLLSLNRTPPRYFQVLLRVAVDNGIPTTISMVAVHELHSDRR